MPIIASTINESVKATAPKVQQVRSVNMIRNPVPNASIVPSSVPFVSPVPHMRIMPQSVPYSCPPQNLPWSAPSQPLSYVPVIPSALAAKECRRIRKEKNRLKRLLKIQRKNSEASAKKNVSLSSQLQQDSVPVKDDAEDIAEAVPKNKRIIFNIIKCKSTLDSC